MHVVAFVAILVFILVRSEKKRSAKSENEEPVQVKHNPYAYAPEAVSTRKSPNADMEKVNRCKRTYVTIREKLSLLGLISKEDTFITSMDEHRHIMEKTVQAAEKVKKMYDVLTRESNALESGNSDHLASGNSIQLESGDNCQRQIGEERQAAVFPFYS